MNTYRTLTSVFILAALFSACSHSREDNATATLPSIDVAYPEVDSIVLYRNYPGYLSANLEVNLVARVNGYLKSAGYTAGTIVRKGQVLFSIEDSQYRDAVSQAQARLETARSSYAYASSQYEAMKKALESDAVSRMDVIQAESSMNESLASIKSAEAALQTALTNLSYCTVRAPFTGRISTAAVDAGTYLNGGASPVTLATLYDDSIMNTYFAIEDNSYLKMLASRGSRRDIDYTRVPIRFNEPLPHAYTGNLDYMSPDVDTGTGTLRLRARISNPHGELRSGMFATIAMPYDIVPKALLVRDASIGTDQLGHYVYTVTDSGKVVYTPIKTGDLANDSMRIVTGGLTPQSRYVTKALLKVRDGMTVNPIVNR